MFGKQADLLVYAPDPGGGGGKIQYELPPSK